MAKEIGSVGRLTLLRHGKGEHRWVRKGEGRNLRWFRTRKERWHFIMYVGRTIFHWDRRK